MRSNWGAWYSNELALANGFALVKRAVPGDAGVETRVQPSKGTHSASQRRRLRRGIGVAPHVQRAEQHPTCGGFIPYRGVEHGYIHLSGVLRTTYHARALH